MKSRNLFIVTGMAGAGKSQVIKALEDAGFYCVDNLPVDLLPKFLELIEGAGGELGAHVALGLDLRESALDVRFPGILELLKKSNLSVRILFLDASDEALVRRYSETRRPHPLAPRGSVLEGVHLERARLTSIREKADRVLDTTGLTVHELRRTVQEDTEALTETAKMTVNIISFGFSYGLPPEASLVFDVRFLPNPHFVPDLRPLTGEDPPVCEYVCNSTQGKAFLEMFLPFVRFLIPRFRQEGKAYLTLAVGCTGGRHRSVAVARWLYNALLGEGEILLNLWHRDRGKPTA